MLVAEEGGHFRPVNVVPGISDKGWVEILSGLNEGEKVVTSGQFLIDSEASLRSALPEQEGQPKAQSTAKTYDGEGVVKAVSAEAITIAHHPIPALNWGAMVMPFALKSPTNLKPGDSVMFSFTMDDEQGAVITHLMPTAEAHK
ncbi:Cation efflux system protein CusB precursor [Cedecea neteri]|uniref:Cation efflux system protein CusB n=1 Tax=Cedecea neteri TaxID=158822 RepID=A0A2X2TBU5_9ENTR|nr:Cation efflux system protein CusB precursor [Cedecea neteri]